MTELAAGAFVELATEAFLYQVVQTVAQGFQLHLVNDLVDEGVLQQHLGLGISHGDVYLTVLTRTK